MKVGTGVVSKVFVVQFVCITVFSRRYVYWLLRVLDLQHIHNHKIGKCVCNLIHSEVKQFLISLPLLEDSATLGS